MGEVPFNSSEAPPHRVALEDLLANPAIIESLPHVTVRVLLHEATARLHNVAMVVSSGKQLKFDFDAEKAVAATAANSSLLKAREAAVELNVDVAFLYEAARKGKIRKVELGRWIRFRRDDIERAKREGLPMLN